MKEEKVGYSHKIGEIDDNPSVSDVEIEEFIKEYAREQIKKKKIIIPLLDAYAIIEKNELRVQCMVCSPRFFDILRKYYGDLLDQNTEKKTLLMGYFGMFWGTMIFVKKDFEGVRLFSEYSTEFKEEFPEYSQFVK
jgi:hypothetical protein